MRDRVGTFLIGGVWAILCAPVGANAESPAAPSVTPAAAQFFETSVRPVFAEHCYECHGPAKHKGGLRLDSRAALLRGGELGPAIVPGKPEESWLVKAVGYAHADLQMPPKKKLSGKQVADLTQWVNAGAPWPGADASGAEGTTAAATHGRAAGPAVTEADRSHWAFQPVRRPPAPAVRGAASAANPIDAFILAKLEQEGLTQNPPAGPRELIRRAYFNLTGLPPTAEEVEAFAADFSPAAFERVVDRLLASPRYGERWARHWLDVVRYAQTNGYERDGEKPYAWRYRDYVIRSLNDDKPYDQFVREQLAGDELDKVTDDARVATGFYHLGVWDDEPDDKKTAEYDYHDDNLRTIGAGFLGLTVGCARCHDHKTDPIPQADYYRLLAFVANVRPPEKAKPAPDSPAYVPLGGEWALAVRERGQGPRPTHLLVRGSAASPGVEVRPQFLEILGGAPAAPGARSESTGLRRALAEQIASAKNPLTARVMVNRIWQHHFGRGLVATPDDFGKTGTPPTHPELLDWLAEEFIAGGWSVKRMHKRIMLSGAYRMSSRAGANPTAAGADPDNRLLWRQNMRRLDAEAIRDAVLAASGELNTGAGAGAGGRGFFPRLSREVIAGGSRPGLGWDASSPQERNRRSVYAFVKRSMLVPLLESFDFTNVAFPAGERVSTTVAPQALMLLNDDFMHEQADAFARRVVAQVGTDRRVQVRRAYAAALGRAATAGEIEVAEVYLDRQAAAFAALRGRMTFEPQVPPSLAAAFISKLGPADFLSGPRAGWRYGRGNWGEPYEAIVTIDPARGPFALAENYRFRDGTIRARLMLRDGVDTAGVLVRANPVGDHAHSGYDVVLDARGQALRLRRHDGKAVSVLASAPADVRAERWTALRVEAAGPRLRVWLDGAATPLLDVTDSAPLAEPGHPGVRVWGAGAADVEDFVVEADGKTTPLGEGLDDPAWAERQALASLCLVLLNLNEFVYVD